MRIDEYTELDRDYFSVLRRQFHAFVHGEECVEAFSKFQDAPRKQTLIAHHRGKPVGFLSYASCQDRETRFSLNWILRHSRNKQRIERELRRNQRAWGGKVVYSVFDAPPELRQPACASDLYIVELFVLSSARKQGIGTALVEHITNISRDHSSRAFVSEFGGSNAAHLYGSLGFVPLLRIGPRYYGGYAETLMAKALRTS